MPTYRTFRNTDPPVLADLWRSRAAQAGLGQTVSVDLFEQFVFGKLYFDYEGMILGFEADRPVGFAHAAFGPNATEEGIDHEKGVICLVVVRPDCREAEVAEGLLERCERYLRRRGARVFCGGAAQSLDPFYLGLYGRCKLPTVLSSEEVSRRLYPSHGYREVDRTLVFRSQLDDFRAPADRRHVQLRRRLIVEMKPDPPARTWWEACATAELDLTRFEVSERGSSVVLASATFRAMQPTTDPAPGRIAELLDVGVAPGRRRGGLASFLLAESFRRLARQGIASVEAQASRENAALVALCRKLGMREVDQGSVFCKEAR
jgi:ribosomal protein S18 acetylase RimI-like enzyme